MVLLDYEENYQLDELTSIIHWIRDNQPDARKVEREAMINDMRVIFCDENITIALLALDTIVMIDAVVFGNQKIKTSTFVTQRGKHLAFYDDKTDTYGVMVRDIHELNDSMSFDVDEEGKINFFQSPLSATVLGIAVHEVRHRLQYREKLRLFTRNTITRDKRINGLIYHQSEVFNIVKDLESKKTRSKKYVRQRISPIEFDASFIEHYCVAEALRKKSFSFSWLKKIVTFDPVTLIA